MLVIPKDQDQAQIELRAADDIEAGQSVFKVKADMNKSEDLKRVLLKVTQPGWFDLKPLPKIVLLQGHSDVKTIQVERKWYQGAIEIEVGNLPKGVTAGPVTIAGDKNSADITFSATVKAIEEGRGQLIFGEPFIRATGRGLKEEHQVKALGLDFWLIGEIRKFKLDSASRVVFSPNGRQALSVDKGRGSVLSFWNVETGEGVHRDEIASIYSMALAPDASFALFASSAGNGEIKHWDTKTLKARRLYEGPANNLAISTDSKRFAFVGVGGIYLGSLEMDSKPNRALPGNSFQCLALGQFILTSEKDTLFFPQDGDFVQTAKQAGNVACLTFLPDGRRNLSGGDDGTIWLWDWNKFRSQRVAKRLGKQSMQAKC
jgi:hypothetical protein